MIFVPFAKNPAHGRLKTVPVNPAGASVKTNPILGTQQVTIQFAEKGSDKVMALRLEDLAELRSLIDALERLESMLEIAGCTTSESTIDREEVAK